ncbi:TerB family tellurite resistance protein [Lignipirellula cremea]|uniref:Zinc-ribbon 15 domain-containing protein n=1 Tax=Lignipirellula cremea TaxID=2528010 RepID=A0A518DY01_9BACT|nr:zinc-ribbon domain-containing protein [Lignipirellula cremea]QDU96671.1 hypothetical protein Pla8534_44920 [Lignipirellula cremea]
MLAFILIYGTRGISWTTSTGDFHCPECETQCGYKCKKVRIWFTLYFIPVIPLHSAGEYVHCSTCRSAFDKDILYYNRSQAPGAPAASSYEDPDAYSNPLAPASPMQGYGATGGYTAPPAPSFTPPPAYSAAPSYSPSPYSSTPSPAYNPSPTYAAQDPEAKFQQQFHEGMVRAMVLLCVADGGVTPADRRVMQSMMQRVSGNSFDQAIQKWVQHLTSATPADYVTYLKRVAPHLQAKHRVILVSGLWETSNATTLSAGKRQMLTQTPPALGMSNDEFKAIIARKS